MKTKLQVEHYLGDLIKVVATQLEHLLDEDQLQIAEINSVVEARIMSLPDERKKQKRKSKKNTF